MRIQLSVLVCLLLAGCYESGENISESKEYFDLDSLLDTQVDKISQSGLKLTKKVSLDGEMEEKTFDLDTSRLTDEFNIFREFDLNKTNYKGAYEVDTNGNTLRYALKPNQKSPVESVEILRGPDGNLKELKGFFFEDKSIYQLKREIKILFSDGLISSYKINGYQDMIFKEPVEFRTEATFR